MFSCIKSRVPLPAHDDRVCCPADVHSGVLRIWTVSRASPVENLRLKRTGFHALHVLAAAPSLAAPSPHPELNPHQDLSALRWVTELQCREERKEEVCQGGSGNLGGGGRVKEGLANAS